MSMTKSEPVTGLHPQLRRFILSTISEVDIDVDPADEVGEYEPLRDIKTAFDVVQ
jgi:hypothetical protein